MVAMRCIFISHFHFGIHKNSYANTPTFACDGGWRYQGYSADPCVLPDWYDPSDFIADHPVTILIGHYADGWHNDGTSEAFLGKYQEMQTAGHTLGQPWDNGGSIYVHELNGMLVQDFFGQNNGYYHPYSAIVYYQDPWMSREAHVLKEGFWTTYMDLRGWLIFGCPVTDEYPNSGRIWQSFNRFGPNYANNQNDYERYYFRWDPDTQVLDIIDGNYQQVFFSELTVMCSVPKSTVHQDTNDRSGGSSGGGGSSTSRSNIRINHQGVVGRTSLPDGVYHSGMEVTSFEEPVDLVDGDLYQELYAVVNGGIIPIDEFTMDGDLTIYIDESPPEGAVEFLDWTIYPDPCFVSDEIHVEGRIANVGSAPITFAEIRVELLKPNGDELFHWSEYNITLDPDWWWTQWLYTYPNIPGNHTARFRGLINGQWQTYSIRTVTVYGLPPIADFFVIDPPGRVGTAPFTAHFSERCADYSDLGDPTVWTWYFGDGTVVSGNITTPYHTYQSAGIYDVSLRVTNFSGTDIFDFYSCITVYEGLDASFEADTTSGTAPTTIHFADQSLGTPTSWLWNFGDGSTSTNQNPSHYYSMHGTYDVSLIVANSWESDTLIIADYISLIKVMPPDETLPSAFPNPSNPIAVIKYSVEKAGHVKLDIYDLAGRRVSTLVDQTMDNGIHEVTFDGSSLPSGIYFYRLSTPEGTTVRKIVVLK